jgi:hypothetical protein
MIVELAKFEAVFQRNPILYLFCSAHSSPGDFNGQHQSRLDPDCCQ